MKKSSSIHRVLSTLHSALCTKENSALCTLHSALNTKGLFLMLLFCISAVAAHAQGTRISGFIDSPDGPVIMCNVVEIDNNNRIISATQTDINGNFSMTIKNKKNKLKIAYVGYKTEILPIGDKTTFELKLKDENQLQEVVVTAKSTQRSGGLLIPDDEVTGAAQTFDMSNVEGLAFTSADEALQGQIAGLDIVANSGNLGAGTSMRLRGVSTINTSAEPLIVVDGNEFENPDPSFSFEDANEESYASLLSINPQDIEDIKVLKDGAETAIWGSKGSNGVISIRTKRGRRGPTRVDYSLRLSVRWAPKNYDILNGDDYTMMLKEMYYNPSQSATATTNINEINYNKSWAEYENWNNNTDWMKAVSKTGVSHYHTLTLSGGGEKANFRISASYDGEAGTIIEQKLDRFSTRLALDYFVSDRIKFSTTFPLTYTKNHMNYYGDILARAQRMAPNMSIYRQDANGNDTNEYYIMLPSGKEGAGSTVPGTSSSELASVRAIGNPVAIARQAWKNETTYRISPEFKITYQLLGIDDNKTKLEYEGLAYFDIYSMNRPTYMPASLTTNGWTDGSYNYANTYDYNSLNFVTRHHLVFTPKFKSDDFFFTILGQWELRTGSDRKQEVAVVNIPTGVTSTTIEGYSPSSHPWSANSRWRSMAWVFNAHFSYKGKYVAGASIRGDGTTKFGSANKWGYFPSASLRWNIHKENFMKWMEPVVSELAARASWGVTGRTPDNEFLQYAKYATSGIYGNGTNNASVSYAEGLQLNNLKWQSTTQINIGGNLGFLNNMIYIDGNYYFKRTKDLLMANVAIPTSSGFSRLPWKNVGTMTNQGYDINVTANKFVKAGIFSMSANFNIGQNINNIEEMDPSVLEAQNAEWSADARGQYLNRIQVGNPLASIYGLRYKGVYQYTYEYLTDMKDRNKEWTAAQYENELNKFIASGKTAPVAIGADGKVIMDPNTGYPRRLVYNYKAGSSTYQFQGGDAIYEDINHDGQINALDVVYLGNSNPKFQGGFGLTFFIGQFTLSSSFTFRGGVSIVNNARMGLEEMFNANNQSHAVNYRWRKNGDVTQIPRAMYNTGYNWLGSDRYVEDAAFLRLGYLQLKYAFSKNILKATGLRRLELSVAAQNLFCWSKYSGTDPEHNPGAWGIAYDNEQTPRAKTVTFNFNIGF